MIENDINENPPLLIASVTSSAVFHGDCLEIMKSIPDGSIDMILCDLPYGTTQNKWDSVIDLEKMWNELWRVGTPNVAVVLFSAQPFTTTLISSQIKNYKYEWVWIKNLKTGNLNARKMPMGGHETIQVFYKKPPIYNPQKRLRTTEIKSGNKFNSKTTNYGKQQESYVDRQGDFICPDTAITNIKCVHNSSGKLHPTEKPVELCTYFIKTYSNEKQTVLDMTAGSGTTGISCIDTNRNYILIEKEQKYFDIINERIDKHKSIKNKKPFKIICTKGYEFEGTIFKTGDIGYNSFGRNVPDNWEKYNYENES